MNTLLAIGVAMGLAGAAAFRGFFPLVISLLFVRFTEVINFPPALEWLQSIPMLLVLLALMIIEFLIDDLPGVGFLHSSVYTGIKVLIGGILFASVLTISPVLGILIGGLITGFLIFSRLAFEPWLTQGQPYFRHLEYQEIENIGSIALTIISLAIPWLSLLLVCGLIYLLFRVGRKIT